ncbi:hypothetical protein LOTGIDRAFT_238385 [Lottia gigantea]|uniref:Uncharacterized protein n=1 Tax=Lottia gigantea TaxID=225164 RepID=V4B506_LOTGI|nr:hypothetical protein LOTGIDRAFT_238385 [Lottia gigantea]ESP01042.1 hypothetical protein LOTGIDRAFT_238385 [Lottia gigantea]
MWKTINRSRLYIGLLIFISLTMIYFYTTSPPQLSFRLHFFNDDTQLYSNNKKESQFHVETKSNRNTYTVVKVNANANNKSNTDNDRKINTKPNVKLNTLQHFRTNVKSKTALNIRAMTNTKRMTSLPSAKKLKNRPQSALEGTLGAKGQNITKIASNVPGKVSSKVKTTSIANSKSNTELKKNITATSKKHSKPSVNNTTQSVVVKITKTTKYLIYLCDSKRYCGGFSDRQRGIAYTFMMSIQLDRKFGIIMSTPCDVRQFFIPNKYNWIIPESDLIGNPQKIINSVGLGGVNLSNDTTEIIYLRTNAPGNDYIYRRIRHKLPPYLKGGTTRRQIFKLIWESLMKPSRHVINHLKRLSLSKDMTCAHVRIGKSRNLPNDPARNNLTSVPKLWDFMDKFDKANTIFVATDNIEVRDSARRRFTKRYFDSEGKILHIDRQKGMDADCLGFETSIIDQIILSKCKVLIVSNSGFSIRAAIFRNNAKDLYIFNRSEVKPFKLP